LNSLLDRNRTWIAAAALSVSTACVAVNPVADINVSTDQTTQRHTESLQKVVDGSGLALLSAQTVNGAISVNGTDGPQVVVRIRKEVRAPTMQEAEAFASQVSVTVERRGAEVIVSRDYPRPPSGVQVSVSYEIDVPAAAGLDLLTTNGAVHIADVSGRVDAATTNGAIALLAVSGPVTVRTTNGGVEARLERLEGFAQITTTNGSVNLTAASGVASITAVTTNGSIEAVLPSGFSGRLEARTSNGRVYSDLRIADVTSNTRTRLAGVLGAGGDARVRITTSNGDVSLRQQP
jgi:DUF4097 and DUF4098 domain-containing protein YvlB